MLSPTTDAQSPNINYNCNLYNDQYADDDYADDQSSVNYDSNISHTNDIVDTDDINDKDFQEPFMSFIKPSSQQTNASNRFQIMLHDLVMKHRASLQTFDDICNFVNEYTASPDFSVMTKLPSQKSFLRSIKETYCTHGLRPTNRIVRLHDNSYVTVPVFDTKEMIISLLTDPSLMTDSNFAKGYDVLTGEVDMNNPCNWKSTRNRYCTVTEQPTLPVALIVFGDKSHRDLHGTLSLTPIIFTLTLFNQSACNNTRFWRFICYIPNLSYAKGVADRRLTKDKIQDKHTCISCILQSLCNISNEGGFNLVILRQNVRVKVWIHYFTGDMEGNNKWLGQYPGN